jgi:uncharacterized membrane protein YeiH
MAPPLDPASLAASALPPALWALDMAAVAVFAITGALVAARKEMDPIGFIFLGTVTGIGGGTFRDLVLGVPPIWLGEPLYLWVCIIASLATFFGARLLSSRYRALLWMDAVGLAMFSVTGAQKSALLGYDPLVSIIMGVMTATLGGLVRDVLAGERPLLFHREIYASAAIVAGSSYLLVHAFAPSWNLPPQVAPGVGFVLGLLTRACAIRYGLSMPTYKRPNTPLDGPTT